MKATVIIPTYNREQQLVDTIRYVLANTYPEFEVIVVDQTKEHTPEITAALHAFKGDARFRYIQLPVANLPYARNVGLYAAKGQVIIYVDDDVELESDFIARHTKPYQDSEVGAVGGRILTQGYESEDHATEVAPIGRLSKYGPIQGHFYREGPICDIEWGMGCNMSFRYGALMEVGGFDERYTGVAKHEDADAFVRVRQQGYKAVFAPSAKLIHLKSPGGGCRSDQEFLSRHRSILRSQALIASCINPNTTPKQVLDLVKRGVQESLHVADSYHRQFVDLDSYDSFLRIKEYAFMNKIFFKFLLSYLNGLKDRYFY
jgi:GT2 family glycosyltransferase